MTLEEQLVRHVCERSYSDISAAAIEAARREVLWALGTSFAGASAPGSDCILAFARQMGGAGAASVIGYGDRLSPLAAGLANGCFAKALEYEDKYWIDYGCCYAIGTAVVPAGFATAEQLGGVDGRAFLAAVALATDVAARMIKAVPKTIYTGWNSTYLFSAFGAAMVAGKLMGLTRAEMHNALGLAYAQTTGSRQNMIDGALGNRIQMGFGVRNGLSAAQLAQLGASGAKGFLVGKFGLYSLFLKDTEFHLDDLTEGLGENYLGNLLGYKAYPCCAATHAALDAIASLIAEGPLDAEAIDAVNIYGTAHMTNTVEPIERRQVPKTQPDAQFSMAWSAACLLADGRLGLSHYTEAALGKPRYANLARKVKTEMDPNRALVQVEIRMQDGRTLRSRPAGAPKGHPENPLSLAEMVAAYRDCMKNGPKKLPLGQTERAKDLVLGMQDQRDATDAIRLLA